MPNFIFTYIHKEYFDVEIEASNASEAREMFDNMVLEDKIDWQNPDYMDSDTYFEES
jgi:uncharacterized protein YjbK